MLLVILAVAITAAVYWWGWWAAGIFLLTGSILAVRQRRFWLSVERESDHVSEAWLARQGGRW